MDWQQWAVRRRQRSVALARRPSALALVGCLVAAALTLWQADQAYAAFSARTHSTGSFTAAVLQPPTAFTATAGCTPTSSTTIGFRASSSATGSTTITAARPSGIQPGDLLLALYTHRREAVTITPPAGWTLLQRLDSPAGGLLSTASYYREATSADPASWTWTSSTLSADNSAVVIVGYSGVSTAVVPISAAQGAESTTATAPSVTTVRPDHRLVALFGYRGSGGFTPEAGLTEREDIWTNISPASANVVAAAADAPFGPVGSTGARTATATSNFVGHNVGHLIALRPQSSPRVALSWAATTSTYASGYTVQRLQGGAPQGTQSVSPASVTSLTDVSVAGSTTYEYRIRTAAGNWSSTAATAGATTISC